MNFLKCFYGVIYFFLNFTPDLFADKATLISLIEYEMVPLKAKRE